MESSTLSSSHIPTRSSSSRQSPRGPTAAPARGSNASVDAAGRATLTALPSAVNARRLIANEQYFGLEAKVLRAGAARALTRISKQPPEQAWIDIHSLGKDFKLDAVASEALLSAFLTGGLLHPDGTGAYRATDIFREYALACVVAPLPRARAKTLIIRACRQAARINSALAQNPFQIEMVAVSGSYMSLRDELSELSLSLILRRRPNARTPGSGSTLCREDALRQIMMSMKLLSSFIVVRIVADRQAVQRPFSVVFQSNQDVSDSSVVGWDRFREWSISIGRWLALR